MICEPRSDLRQLPSGGRGWQKTGARRLGRARATRKSFVTGFSNSGSQVHSAWLAGHGPGATGRQDTQALEAGGTALEPSFTCEPRACGLIFHGPAQKLLRFTGLGVATAQIAPWSSLASGRQKT